MSDFWLKLKIWTKVLVFVVVVIFVTIFLIKNESRTAQVWLVGDYTTTVLRLLFGTYLFGVVSALLIRAAFRTVRQISDLNDRSRAQRMDRELAQMHTQPRPAAPPPTTPPTTAP